MLDPAVRAGDAMIYLILMDIYRAYIYNDFYFALSVSTSYTSTKDEKQGRIQEFFGVGVGSGIGVGVKFYYAIM